MRRRTMMLSIAAVAGGGAIALRRGSQAPWESWRSRMSSHDAFSHDSIDSLGYDWVRVADRSIAPRYPRKIYLPRSTDDVVEAVREAHSLGETLKIRSKGHSSNDLVLTDGSVLLTEKLDAILSVDEHAMTVTVQSGTQLATIDDHLAPRGFGLPIIGTHNHITAGGFAAVGGISAAAHRHGLFVDNVVSLEYVDWDGNAVTCSPTDRADDFYRVLTSLGRYGVITQVTIRMVRIDKYHTILENSRTTYRNLDRFLEAASSYIADQGDVQYARVLWLDAAVTSSFSATLGSISLYRHTEQTLEARIRNAIAYGYLHRIGYLAGRMPAVVEQLLRLRGVVGLFFSPRYASIKNVEIFMDKILDYSVGDPIRWIVTWTPADHYEPLFRAIYAAMRETRRRHDCFTFVSCDIRPFKSPYLAHGDESKRYVDLVFEVGIKPKNMTPDVLRELVEQVDDLVIAHGAYRYMHSVTSKDADRLAKIDPNTIYAAGRGVER
jgi:hypothetical protein